ncbi:MAG: hypothetical protein H0U97_16715 [Gammaproteobacteria bacterium]|nr:hypothetical protein [Gammaproteobacteria bacterium]
MSTVSQRCNAFLMGSDQAGRDAVRQLEAIGRNDERLHTYNRSPLLNRPGLLQAADVATLEQDLATLLEVLTSLPDRLFDGRTAAMCERVGINGPARQAVLDTVDEFSVLLARADVVWSVHGPKAIEFNIHSSLGGMDIGPLNETFLKLPVYGDFLRAESLRYHDPLDSILAEILQAATDRGMTGTPTVALVDWPTSYPIYEQVLERVCALMRARGIDAIHTHVGRLEERNGYLWYGKVRIDVLYRIFMLEDIPEQPDLITPIIDVHRAGNVLLAMSFFAELVGNKASLALLSEPTNPDFLTAEERATVDRILPQTRLLRHGRATWDGEWCDVTDVAIARKNELIMKPAIGHGTLGVIPGWAVTEKEWRQALGDADGDMFVLQERVAAAPEQIPTLDDDEWRTCDYDVNWGVFIHQRRYAGAMLRALPSSRPGVISLGAGGAVGCCFHQDAPSDGDE